MRKAGLRNVRGYSTGRVRPSSGFKLCGSNLAISYVLDDQHDMLLDAYPSNYYPVPFFDPGASTQAHLYFERVIPREWFSHRDSCCLRPGA